MDFELSEHQRTLRSRAEEFGAGLYASSERITDADRDGVFSRDIWQRCAEYGLLGLNVPAELGGKGYSNLDSVLVMEGLGRGCPDNGIVFGVSAQAFSVVDALVRFGDPGQQARYLIPVLRGEKIGCFAITEPGAGSDCFALESRAEPAGGGRYRLNGRKQLITFAPVADFALVFASTDAAAGPWGITAFLVDAGRDGYAASPVQDKMGLRTIPIGELGFNDLELSDADVLGKPGSGASVFNATQETERSLILAGQLGAMGRQLESSIRFARSRRQFGQSIGKFQTISNRIAEMKLRHETSRLLLYQTAWLRDDGRSGMLESSLTNWHLAEAFLESSIDALRITGGRGFLTDYHVERDMRDAMGAPLYGGTSDMQRQIVARLLGL